MDRITEACSRMDLAPAMEASYRAVFDKCADWKRLSNDLDANSGVEEYSIAQRLHQAGFLDERRICTWRDGRPHGKRVEFRQAVALDLQPND